MLCTIMVLASCGLGKEKEAAEKVAKELGASAFEVKDTTVYEKKAAHATLLLLLTNPKMEAPELDYTYLSSKAAYSFLTNLGMANIGEYQFIAVKLITNERVFQTRFSVKTLNRVYSYYTLSKKFIYAVDTGDNSVTSPMVKPDIISAADLIQIHYSAENYKYDNGELTGIKHLGFDETYIEETGRNVMIVRTLALRNNKASEIYNFTFDRADQKIVGMAWDAFTPQAPPTPKE